MSLLVSLCALFATFFELYLQRRHNEKSLKPIPQIVLGDKEDLLFVQIQNNGVGPLIVERLSFRKNDIDYPGIEECLTLDPRSYNHDTEISKETPKVILPGGCIEVFGMVFEGNEGEKELEQVRSELSEVLLTVTARDIYNNEIAAKRNFRWFVRHRNHIG